MTSARDTTTRAAPRAFRIQNEVLSFRSRHPAATLAPRRCRRHPTTWLAPTGRRRASAAAGGLLARHDGLVPTPEEEAQPAKQMQRYQLQKVVPPQHCRPQGQLPSPQAALGAPLGFRRATRMSCHVHA